MMNKFGVVGFGKMGHALVAGMAKIINVPVMIFDVSKEALNDVDGLGLKDVELASDIETISDACDVVLVAVKPAQAPEVFEKLEKGCAKTILSIVAGLTIDRMKSLVPSQAVIRIMPNTPALVGAASIVVVDNGLTPKQHALASELMSTCGACHFVKSESQLDAVTGLSGSGPALFAVIAQALADAAVAEGLPRNLANDLARETMLGTAKLMEIEHPAIIKENVMSPGGTTAAGILASEQAGIRSACQAFVCAAAQKSRSL